MVVSPAFRSKFVESSVKLLEDYGLDGLDIDYEYPQNSEQAKGYTHLLKELRHALDEHQRKKGIGYRFLLTVFMVSFSTIDIPLTWFGQIAAPCGPQNYHKLHVAEMDRYLDFWNLMAYDYGKTHHLLPPLSTGLICIAHPAGSWDSVSGHQANIRGGDISGVEAVKFYHTKGVPRHKLILGIPLYGRSFMNTEGPGKPFSGVGPGSWEKGVYDYRALPLPGSYMFRDEAMMASWSYDYDKKEMISFDSEEVAKWKGEWIKREGLGGSMFWELSGDKGSERKDMERGPGKDPQPGRSLVKVVKHAMGPLDSTHNWLRYEGSKFENLRKGME